MANCRCSTTLITSFIVVGSLVLFALFDFTYLWIKYDQEVKTEIREISVQIHAKIDNAIDNFINDTKVVSNLVRVVEPNVIDQTLPPDAGGYDPSPLIRIMNSLELYPAAPILTAGISMYRQNPPTAKATWEVSPGFGCSYGIYAWIDGSTNEQFLGTCVTPVNRVNTSNIIYRGQDWGLKPLEVKLLAGIINNTFLPISDLLDVFTLTYEQTYWPPNLAKPYCLTFVEKSLENINSFMSQLSTSESGIAYIVDQSNDLIISASVPDQTSVVINGQRLRYSPFNASNGLIQASAFVINDFSSITEFGYFDDGDSNGNMITVSPKFDNGLRWVKVVVLPKNDFYRAFIVMRNGTIGISFAILFSVIIVSILLIYCCVKKPLNKAAKYITLGTIVPDHQRSINAEVYDIEESINRRNAHNGAL